ncbi:MAG: terminase gpA endonuclease subunit [Rhodospirillaceae bacterium]|nr:terminase gpA endonuclease subunit [Rhodospirillaceae bacterium]
MDCLNPWSVAEVVTLCKSAQVGGSEIILNWILAIADMWPAPTMAVRPTLNDAQAWVREKVAPTIRSTPAARRVIAEQRSRDGTSTTMFKSFPRGFLVITGANTSVDISSKSVRFVAKDEWDRWPADVDGQGDPDALVNARQISYHASGQAKTLQVSTPTVKGAETARIMPAYLAGDRRKYFVPCPHCGHAQELRFKPLHADGSGHGARGGLKFDSKAQNPPATAVYVCEANGCIIEPWQKTEMLARGRWRSTLPPDEAKGRQPSFHLNALYSPVTTWAKMVEAFLAAKDNPQKLKAFTNLWLGEEWEERGDAPEIERLLALRGDFERLRVPPGGLILTGTADVQKDGIYYEIVAWGRDGENWSIDAGYLDGDTASETAPVWDALREVFDRGYRDAYGNVRRLDQEGVDAGFNSNAVYAFVRKRPRAMALKGEDGWYRPPLAPPVKQDVTVKGKKKRRGVKLWAVGIWSLKSELYAALRLKGVKEGAEINPPAYCHFSLQIHDEGYFKQLTAEHLKDVEKRGRIVKEWQANGPNHWHDCRIYNMALAYHLRVPHFSDEDWARIAAARERPPEAVQGELGGLFSGLAGPVAKAEVGKAPLTPPPPTRGEGGPRKKDWLARLAQLNSR